VELRWTEAPLPTSNASPIFYSSKRPSVRRDSCRRSTKLHTDCLRSPSVAALVGKQERGNLCCRRFRIWSSIALPAKSSRLCASFTAHRSGRESPPIKHQALERKGILRREAIHRQETLRCAKSFLSAHPLRFQPQGALAPPLAS